MEDQKSELSQGIYDVLMTPIWLDISIGVMELAMVIIVIFIAHHLARRKLIGGTNMLVCVYLSILAALVPIALPVDSEDLTSNAPMVIFGSQIASTLFALFASIHCLRYVLASTANKANQV